MEAGLQSLPPGVRPVATDTALDEVILPPESRQRIDWIVQWVRHSPHELSEWGLRRYFDGGLRALFRGASGTGKSMAAAGLAREVGLPLLRVDLSAIVSKYIGETERNLRQLFDAARDQGAVLVFDEADGLLGKRGAIRDAHDRHANAEVGTLLRWMEGYEGLAILTTSAKSELAGEAVSRVDVIVEFPMPDEAARRALWEGLLRTVTIFGAANVDVAGLANSYELSGAEILRCVRMASLLAASGDTHLDGETLKAFAAERAAMRSVAPE
jgi:SpoVK/Ycf46/Vps4 family AAA+-type ATPase